MRILFCLLLFWGVGTSYAQNQKIAKNYKIAFSSDDATGIFEEFSGKISFHPNELDKAYFVFVIKVSSIATGNFLKNSHAKGEDWFDATKYPNIKFLSNQQGFKRSENGYEVTGFLQMHGVSKEITIPFTYENNTLKATFSVDRTDYGIGKSDNGVSKIIKITASVPLK